MTHLTSTTEQAVYTEFAARTTYQVITYGIKSFLVTRTDWSTERFPDQYGYDVYEHFQCSQDWKARHSVMYHALGATWGNIESWFDERQFAHLPSGTADRYRTVRIYHDFRKAIAAHFVEIAQTRAAWERLPFVD